MSLENGQYLELANLLELLCEDRISHEQASRIEDIVLADTDARRFYLSYLDLHGALHWDTAIGDNENFDRSAPVSAPLVAANHVALAKPSRRQRSTSVVVAMSLLLVVSGVYAVQRFVSDQNADFSPNVVDLTNTRSEISSDIALNKILSTKPNETTIAKMADRTGEESLSPTISRKPQPAPTVAINPTDKKNGSATKPSTPTLPTTTKSPATATVANDSPGSSKVLVAFMDDQVRSAWQGAKIEPSPTASDAEWIRRVYLDVVGHIPSPAEAEAFLKGKAPNKRPLLVEKLLDHPNYARNWTTVWTNLLIGRSDSPNISRPALKKYLRESFAQNRPWNEMVYDFVAAEGDYETNGAANFLLAHLNNEAVPATAITAKLFLGTQVQCTQCHDHPFNDWKQNQFWEFNSFFAQTDKVETRKFDKQSGKMVFSHVELTTNDASGPTFYENRRGVMRVAYPKFQGMQINPSEDTNRRLELAKLMTAGKKPQIATAIVNRMWGHFFGYGFTRPIDDMGPHNPPTHPQLLDRLTIEFVASGYDVKSLIRWITNSEAYQLTSSFSKTNLADDPAVGNLPFFSRMYVKSMSAEQLYDSLIIATGAHNAAGSDWTAAETQRQQWLQQFVIAFDTDENDEASTFEGTIPQALMMMNGELISKAVSTNSGTFFKTVVGERNNDTEKIRKLCLSALSRYPSAKEIAAVKKLLRDHVSRAPRGNPKQIAMVEGLQDVFWAYLNSSEFILIH